MNNDTLPIPPKGVESRHVCYISRIPDGALKGKLNIEGAAPVYWPDFLVRFHVMINEGVYAAGAAVMVGCVIAWHRDQPWLCGYGWCIHIGKIFQPSNS